VIGESVVTLGGDAGRVFHGRPWCWADGWSRLFTTGANRDTVIRVSLGGDFEPLDAKPDTTAAMPIVNYPAEMLHGIRAARGCGAADLLNSLSAGAMSFEVVGSAAADPSTARDVDLLLDRNSDAVDSLSRVLSPIAIGDFQGPLSRWLRGVIVSPVTIATIHGPLDIWDATHESS